MDLGADVRAVYDAYEALLADYHHKIESMLAVARDPESNAEQFRTASVEVAYAAERLEHLRVLIKASFDLGPQDSPPQQNLNKPQAIQPPPQSS